MLTLPPPPVPSSTEALIVLSVSCTVPLGFVMILIAPPLAWLASVVTVLFVIVNWLPALIWMLPAFPAPVLLAEIVAPFVRLTDPPATILMSPPGRFPVD